MYCPSTLKSAFLVVISSVLLGALALLAPADAAEPLITGPTSNCPNSRPALPPKPSEAALDEADEVAALSSVQIGLSQMDDGTPFLWKRGNGRLSGMVRPTSSFRSANGRLCRHVVVLLTTGYRTRTAEGVACRMDGGRWKLEG